MINLSMLFINFPLREAALGGKIETTILVKVACLHVGTQAAGPLKRKYRSIVPNRTKMTSLTNDVIVEIAVVQGACATQTKESCQRLG